MSESDSLVFTLVELARMLGGAVENVGRPESVCIRGVTAFSGAAAPGVAFVAVRGAKADGHTFAADAVRLGASAAIVSDRRFLSQAVPGIVVADTRVALSRLAALYNGAPSKKLKVVGMTGTNGKTTINWIVYHLLNKLGLPAVRIGTLGVAAHGLFERPGDLTTPDPIEIHAVMRRAAEGGVKACVIETSSHALDQHRADDVAFDAAVFTNLTRDHLDYHTDMAAYFAAKRRLFELLAQGAKETRAAVINADDDYGEKLLPYARSLGLQDYSYGRAVGSVLRILEFDQNTSGSRTTLDFAGKKYTLATTFIGRHNADNLAAAFASAVALGCEPAALTAAIPDVPAVPGRLEFVGTEDIAVYVDYSHTPDALRHALQSLRGLAAGAIWVVFGCGGDRDRGKRPQMGKIALSYADRVVVTSDNPRTEDPLKIIDEILCGEEGETIRRCGIVEPDRRRAIEKTLAAAKKGDIVLIAGKGHEDYQIIGAIKHHFSDQEEARRILGKDL